MSVDNGSVVTMYSDETKQNAIYPRTTFNAVSGINGQTWQQELDAKTNVTDIKDDLTSTDTDKPLSAKQGKVLNSLLGEKLNIIYGGIVRNGVSKTITSTSCRIIIVCHSTSSLRRCFCYGFVSSSSSYVTVLDKSDDVTVTASNNTIVISSTNGTGLAFYLLVINGDPIIS